MPNRIRALLTNFLTALLMGIGLLVPLLSLVHISAVYILRAVLILTGLTMLRSASRLHTAGKWICEGAMILGFVIWLMTGGAAVMGQISVAAMLCFRGQTVSILLFAQPLSILAAFVIAACSWVIGSRGCSSFFGLTVTALIGIALWVCDREQLLIWLLPALVSAITCTVLTVQEGTSPMRIIPTIAALVAAAFLLTPHGLTFAPLHDSAAELRQLLMDYFFYTEPRDVFSLANEGYYPQGSTQLGGPAEPDNHPVMQVTAPKKVYLRGVTRNEYTGRTWRDTTGGRRYLWGSPQWTNHRDETFNMSLPIGALGSGNTLMTEQTVIIQMLSDSQTTLFVPQRLRHINAGGDLVLYFNNASELFATRNLAAGDTYTVTAPLPIAGEAGLGTIVNACANNPDSDYAAIRSTFTALPSHLEPAVYQLAYTIVDGIESPYEKALAIQQYLQQNCSYTLDTAPQSASMDFVTDFLFNTKEGYCTYFASAMTVLCRMNGLPARYVEGYAATPSEDGIAYVTGQEAHAWTEVYFPGFGWLTFDATPAALPTPQDDTPPSPPEERPEPPEDTPTPTPQPNDDPQGQDEPTPTPEPPQDEPDPSSPPDDPSASDDPEIPPEDPQRDPPDISWLWWLLIPLCILITLVIRICRCRPESVQRRCKTEADAFDVWTQAVFDALHVRRLTIRSGESPRAYLIRIDQLLYADLTLLGIAIGETHYGKLECTSQQVDCARQAYEQVLTCMDRRDRMAFHLRRTFIPLKRRLYTGTTQKKA